MTLTFIIITILYLFLGAAFAKVLHFSTQPDQWLDDLVGWQKMIEKFGAKGGYINKILFKALGGCEFCFAHAITFFLFWLYVFLCRFGFNVWPVFEGVAIQWVFNISWYVLFVSTGTVISSLTINRL